MSTPPDESIAEDSLQEACRQATVYGDADARYHGALAKLVAYYKAHREWIKSQYILEHLIPLAEKHAPESSHNLRLELAEVYARLNNFDALEDCLPQTSDLPDGTFDMTAGRRTDTDWERPSSRRHRPALMVRSENAFVARFLADLLEDLDEEMDQTDWMLAVRRRLMSLYGGEGRGEAVHAQAVTALKRCADKMGDKQPELTNCFVSLSQIPLIDHPQALTVNAELESIIARLGELIRAR